MVENLANEGDEDAVLVCEYESVMQDAVQEDESLQPTFNAYTDARKRLSERFRNRGFWPTSGSKGKGKGHKGRGKSPAKGNFGNRKSLQQRILESNCRHCGRKGHWRAECPERSRGSSSAAANFSSNNGHRDHDRGSYFWRHFASGVCAPAGDSRSTLDAARQQSAYVSVHGVNNFGVNRKVNLGIRITNWGKVESSERLKND